MAKVKQRRDILERAPVRRKQHVITRTKSAFLTDEVAANRKQVTEMSQTNEANNE
jgi:hypothetical protein